MSASLYHIITIGCQMNKSDSEKIATYLEDLGYKKSENKFKSDVVVITTCGVRQSAEDRVYGIVPKIKKNNPNTKIILTGCLSQRKDVRRRLEKYVDVWLPITELSGLAKKLGIKNNLSCNGDYLKINSKYDSKISAFVPIGNGCNNFCAYCVVPYARGREKYREAKEILSEIKSLVERGYKEIILIAQNVNSYQDGKIRFPELLKMVNDVEGDFWIRFATSHPKDMSDELIKAVKECEKVCEHIHLPAQAGSNEILKFMNRKYTIENYLDLISKIRNNIPNVAITTDIIVGFPGETEKQFDDTVKLFKKVKYDMAYISGYSPRPGTAAEKLEDNISHEEKKKREEKLIKILRQTALDNNKKYINKTVEVLIENKKGGKTRTGKMVKINNLKESLIGEFVKVKIREACDFGLIV
ncbi:MAG: tRNA (N6-isopentenyl adenosine(37)-C2)-methylthiotransferase MiaB [bacterium]